MFRTHINIENIYSFIRVYIVYIYIIYQTLGVDRIVAPIDGRVPVQVDDALLAHRSSMVADIVAAAVHLAGQERQGVRIAGRTLDGLVESEGGRCGRRRRYIVQRAFDVVPNVADAGVDVEPQIAGTVGFDGLALVAVVEELASFGVGHEYARRHRLARLPRNDRHRSAVHEAAADQDGHDRH